MKHHDEEQGGQCPLCANPIDFKVPKEGVIDHDHDSGEIRGVLCRGCNGAEGKVFNAVARWGGYGLGNKAGVHAWLERLVAYYRKPGTGLMYYMHKTPEERAQKAKLKAKTRRAMTAAARRLAVLNKDK
jgi:hypothetical protein